MRLTARDREGQVLAAVVELYVEHREPVSSRMIEDTGRLSIKSASIRSVLAELEKRGFLQQPYASAGRIPTDDGYRHYVDDAFANDALPEIDQQQIQQALRAAGADMQEILRATSGVLGRFSQNIAIVAGPRTKSPRITAVELHARGDRQVVVLVSLDDSAQRTELVDMNREFGSELLSAARGFLSERLVGRTLEETRRDLSEMLQPAESEVAVIGAALASSACKLFDPSVQLHMSFEGMPAALEQPEFADPERLKCLLNLMARADDFERALESFVAPGSGEISLAIGSENRLPELRSFSVFATRFELDERYGYLALLGPRRMHYDRLQALIRLVSSHLESLRA